MLTSCRSNPQDPRHCITDPDPEGLLLSFNFNTFFTWSLVFMPWLLEYVIPRGILFFFFFFFEFWHTSDKIARVRLSGIRRFWNIVTIPGWSFYDEWMVYTILLLLLLDAPNKKGCTLLIKKKTRVRVELNRECIGVTVSSVDFIVWQYIFYHPSMISHWQSKSFTFFISWGVMIESRQSHSTKYSIWHQSVITKSQ